MALIVLYKAVVVSSIVIYTMFQKKMDPLLFHHIFALTATNFMKISRST